MAKILIGSELGSYAFDSAAQTITFSGFSAQLERLLLITDTTNNTIIYQFNDTLKGGTLSNNVLTLTYNTNVVGFANTDKLQIFYWSEEPQQTAVLDLAMSIKRDLQMIRREPQMTPTGLNVNVAGGSLTSVTTISNISVLGDSGSGGYAYFTHQAILDNNFYNLKNKVIS